MSSTSNANANGDGEPSGGERLANPHARIEPTPKNPRGYPLFDMRLVPNYTNNQITYHYITGAIPTTKQARFQQLMKQRKASLDLLGWDGAFDEDERPRETPEESKTAGNEIVNSDSNCPIALLGYRGIKINPLNIPKLAYNSTIAQYNN